MSTRELGSLDRHSPVGPMIKAAFGVLVLELLLIFFVRARAGRQAQARGGRELVAH